MRVNPLAVGIPNRRLGIPLDKLGPLGLGPSAGATAGGQTMTRRKSEITRADLKRGWLYHISFMAGTLNSAAPFSIQWPRQGRHRLEPHRTARVVAPRLAFAVPRHAVPAAL
jgi:hypothetical protein